MVNPLTLLPAWARYAVYVGYSLAGLALTGATGYYSQLGLAPPDWLVGSQGIYLALAAPLGVLAASNTDRSPTEVTEVVNPEQDGTDLLPALPEDGDQ